MIGLEMARGIEWDRRRTTVLLGVTAVSLIGAIGYLAIDGNRDGRGKIRQAEVLAITLLESTDDPPPAERQPRDALRRSFDPIDGAKFGYLGFTEREILGDARAWAPNVDSFLARAQRFGLRPLVGVVPVACRPAPVIGGPGARKVYLPRRGAILSSPQSLDLLLGRYGEKATVELGPLGPDRAVILRLRPDDGAARWFVSTGPYSAGTLSDLVLCRYEPARSASLSSLAPDGRVRAEDAGRTPGQGKQPT
jgi:hypothetical protein